jgi:hypothetical protein
MTPFQFILKDHDVEKSLSDLMILLSQEGLTAFLQFQIGPYLARRGKERFASEGDDVSGPWAPLQPATVAIREHGPWAVGGEHPINRREGELENWVVGDTGYAYPVDTGATLHFPKKRPRGELLEKVKTAQLGRSHPSTVPRPVLGVNETDMIFFQTALSLAVEEAIRT